MTSRLKRRSSLGPIQHGMAAADGSSPAPAAPGAAAAAAEDPDFDERAEEERERRVRRGLQKRQSLGHVGRPLAHQSPSGTPAPAAAGTPVGGSGGQQQSVYSAAQLAEHYANCMKLSAENKINVKNAFQLRMIDFMGEMLKKKKSEMDNFQAASCALDASTKIYAYRVDSVHTETLKLASGVGSSKQDKDDNGGDGGGADDDEGDGDLEGGGRKKKKKRKRATMVEKNLNNINCSKFDLEFDVDPLFKKVSAQFDSGGGGGQFLSTLRMRDDGCELVLDSNALASSFSAPGAACADPQEVESAYVPRIRGGGHLICPTFAEFSFRDWSLEKEESMETDDGAPLAKKPAAGLAEDGEHVFDPEAAAANNLDGDDDGGGGFFDGDYVGDGGNEGGEDVGDGFGGGGNKAGLTMALMDVKTLRDHLSAVPTEYSYFDTGRIGAWAGPKHWKFKPLQRGAPASAADADRRSKRQRKDKEKMDFEELDGRAAGLREFVAKALTVPQKSIKLQNKTMMNWSDDKNILPEDMHYSGKDFVKLEGLVKSNVAPRPRGAAGTRSVDDTVEDYNYDNLNDTQNYCPDLGPDSNTYPPEESGAVPDSQNPSALGATGGDGEGLGLIAAPNRVEKVQIGYAKQAKKIDMRRLKTVEWEILNESSVSGGTDKENTRDFNRTDQSAVSLADKGSFTFQEMYTTLLGPSPLPSRMKESLSVPLAFVALLHLCNEQVLELQSDQNLGNLTIRKG